MKTNKLKTKKIQKKKNVLKETENNYNNKL